MKMYVISVMYSQVCKQWPRMLARVNNCTFGITSVQCVTS